MHSNDIQLEATWKTKLCDEFNKSYMQTLKHFLIQEKKAGKKIYPKGENYFRALNLIPFEQVKVVILGQDPYHGPQQATGLSFSVPPHISIPPSLINIYMELQNDLGIEPATHGCLDSWATQGVLLLNSVLTVEHKQAASHQGKGWEQFTDYIIQTLEREQEHLIFILWGNYAQKKGKFINEKNHLIIRSPHPSPLAAHRGFFGSKPFSQVNQYLKKHNKKQIIWNIPHE
ncbi:MAG: uracil-DNA glycosylase [Endozoicomonadaceae bacterium]|nr:uracil-DNA glycosylase [Endozoicomonadaceae bacterium]